MSSLAQKDATVEQPRASMEMNVMEVPAAGQQQQHSPDCAKAQRLRGGGAAKDCFMGAIECFLCFEGCKACCDCFADIICCPCEMVC